ncbi:hypothetical protein FACS1894181_00590 [Bacteroidia bacterium]|nr:hypothetical protein FACS1894181_00590 [Bacteroidia bacterium]
MYGYTPFFISKQSTTNIGFIDTSGKEVIPLIYDDALSFSNGLARVTLNGKRIYINKQGEYVRDAK